MLSWIRKAFKIGETQKKETPKYVFTEAERAILKKISDRVTGYFRSNSFPPNQRFDNVTNTLTYNRPSTIHPREVDLDFQTLQFWIYEGMRDTNTYNEEQWQGWMEYLNAELNQPKKHIKTLSIKQRDFLIKALTLFDTYTANGFIVEHTIGNVTKFITKTQIETILQGGYYDEDDLEAINILRQLYIIKRRENSTYGKAY